MDTVSQLTFLASTLGRLTLRSDLNDLVRRFNIFEKWLTEAHFTRVPEEFVRCITQDDQAQFHLYHRWARKPMKMPSLIIESRIIFSFTSTAELVIQRSEDNFIVVATAPSDTIGSFQYATHVVLDTRHDDIFALALRHRGIRSGKEVLSHSHTIEFLQSVFSQI